MSTVKACLRAARDALGKGDGVAAIKHSEEALQLDPASYEAFLFVGKAAFQLGEYSQSDAAYRKAIELNQGALPAWKGLAELHSKAGDFEKAAEAYGRLLELSGGIEDGKKRLEYRYRLADAHNHTGNFKEAAVHLRAILQVAELDAAEKLRTLCRLADVEINEEQVKLEQAMEKAQYAEEQPSSTVPVRIALQDSLMTSAEGEALTDTLQRIMKATLPSARYIKYYDEYLHRCLCAVLAPPPRSTEREERRTHALHECLYICTQHPGGCCSPLPFEAALWLWEEEEELKGGSAIFGGQSVSSPRHGQVPLGGGFWLGASGLFGGGQDVVVGHVADLGLRFVHQFPAHPAAQAVWALTLRRKLLTRDTKAPNAAAKRKSVAQLLAAAMSAGAPTAAGWKALSELYYRNHQYQAAHDTAEKGLHWLAVRRTSGHETLAQCALPMRVVMARSLLKLGRIKEADQQFRVLAGWVTEGESAFGTLAGGAPMSVHQQALRGVAQCALAEGERALAKSQYEAILGAALMGRGVAEHWAHAEYGWLMAEDGNLKTAEEQLLKAIEIASEPSCHATASELARHHYMLGRVYWNMGGKYKEDQRYAAHHFMAAAQVESPHQGAAFAQLGQYFAEVAHNLPRAKKCFQRAVALDPTSDAAGDGLCDVLSQTTDDREAELKLCEGMVVRAPLATWAHRRLAFLRLGLNDYEWSVTAFQTVLRQTPQDPAVWEGLGAAYNALGRFTAALKAYQRACDLDSSRPYSLIQLATLQASMGQYAEALQQYNAALAVTHDHPAALLGAARALAAQARRHLHWGAAGLAATDLCEALPYARRCTRLHPALVDAWKVLGDVLLAHHQVTPSPSAATNPAAAEGAALGPAGCSAALSDLFSAWSCRIAAVRSARRAYVKGLHADPSRGEHWADVAASVYHESQLRRAHPCLFNNNLVHAQLAEKLLLSGLRLSPASAILWAALGCVTLDRSKKEYALSRSLQLDPCNGFVWVTLACEYMSANENHLADECCTQSRSYQPRYAPAWEVMGAAQMKAWKDLEAATAAYQHAVQMGAGAEAMVGFAVGSLQSSSLEHKKSGLSGWVYSCAVRALAAHPLHPAAHNLLGVVQCDRGQHTTAAHHFRLALELIGTLSAVDCEGYLPLYHHDAPFNNIADMATVVRVNLSGALCRQGSYDEAVAVYQKLEADGVFKQRPVCSIGYAAALQAQGRWQHAVEVLQNGLQMAHAIPSADEVHLQLLLSLVRLLCQQHDLQPAVSMFMTQTASHRCTEASLPLTEQCILVLLSSAVQQGDVEQLGVLQAMVRSFGHFFSMPCSPEFAADAVAILKARGQRPASQDLSGAAAAFHCCPWSTKHGVFLAKAAVHASPHHARPAANLCASLLPSLLHCSDSPSASSSTATSTIGTTPDEPRLLQMAAEVILLGCVSCVAVAGASAWLSGQLSLFILLLRCQPQVTEWWVIVALTSVQVASARGGAGSAYDKAAGWCWQALQRVVVEQDNEAALRVRLLVALSECVLHSSQQHVLAYGSALSLVEQALKAAAGSSQTSDQGLAQRQLGRCYAAVQNVPDACSAYKAACECGDVQSVVELAALKCSLGDDVGALAVVDAALTSSWSAQGTAWRRLLDIWKVQLMVYSGRATEAAQIASTLSTSIAPILDQRRAHDHEVTCLLRGWALLSEAQARWNMEDNPVQLPGDPPSTLSAAWRVLSALGGSYSPEVAALAHVLLAHTLRLDNRENKQDKVTRNVALGVQLWHRPVPRQVFQWAGVMTEGSSWSCKALHTEPWQINLWQDIRSVQRNQAAVVDDWDAEQL